MGAKIDINYLAGCLMRRCRCAVFVKFAVKKCGLASMAFVKKVRESLIPVKARSGVAGSRLVLYP